MTDLDLAESITAVGRSEALVVAVIAVETELFVPAATMDLLYSAGTPVRSLVQLAEDLATYRRSNARKDD